MNKKFRKLLRNPKLFFRDMYEKRKHQLNKIPPITKVNGSNQYTVVSAIYNAEKYLDDLFKSITSQTYAFKKHIHIVCVDDGSTDSSEQIIKNWQKRYPNNITYIYKENGGQGSARNVGLSQVKSDWVTFIDSDDFLAKDYFHQVDKAISENPDVTIVCCNQIYYFEDKNQYIDRHPLNYRFKKQGNLSPCNNLGKNIQFSAALSFFKVDCIPENLLFDEHLKPTFEDGKFVNSYLLSQSNDSFIYFNPNARYYNRKRADKSSTMDGVWLHKGQFSTVFERGYLDILPKCQAEKGYIPKYLQRTILWEMLRLVKYLLNHEEKVYFLSIEEKQNLLELMDKTFKYIDKETIMNYELGNCGFSRQLGMLGCFKMQDVDKQVVYIDKIDFHHHQFQARFFSCFDVDFEIIADGK